jgi:hypothetical protein
MYEPIQTLYLDSFGTLTIQVFCFAFTALLVTAPTAISAVNPPVFVPPVLGYLITVTCPPETIPDIIS